MWIKMERNNGTKFFMEKLKPKEKTISIMERMWRFQWSEATTENEEWHFCMIW
jgi:hypothetical protein